MSCLLNNGGWEETFKLIDKEENLKVLITNKENTY